MHCMGRVSPVEAEPYDVALHIGKLGAPSPHTVEHGADVIRHLESAVFFHRLPSLVAGECGTLHFVEKAQRLGNAAFGALVLRVNGLFGAAPVAEEKRKELALVLLGTCD